MVQTTTTHSVFDEVFEVSPRPLQEVCLSSIVSCLPEITSCLAFKRKQMVFKQKVEISNKVAEKLLEEISKNNLIDSSTLSLFRNQSRYNLKILKLPEINMTVSGKGLLNYTSLNLRELQLGCTLIQDVWSIEKLKRSFSGSSYTLTSLTLNLYPLVVITSGTIIDFFVQFPNLKYLFYESPLYGNDKTFTNTNWNKLLKSCSVLQVLIININGTEKDFELNSKLFLQSKMLQSLTLHSALKSEVALDCMDCVQYFIDLETLRILDLSVDVDPQNKIESDGYKHDTQITILADYINSFLILALHKLQFLESFDISGIYKLNNGNIHNFIETHKNLNFLGLCMLHLDICLYPDIAEEYPDLKISGCFLEDQIIMSLLKYKTRLIYMKETLKGLFQVSGEWDTRRPYIIKIILNVMERFKVHLQLQMAATACIFHLTEEKEGLKNELNVIILSDIARVTSMILLHHFKNLQMVKNCLLIICTDKTLHCAKFDHVAMSRLSLNCMLTYRESVDRHVTRMAVSIVSILACKISSKETAKLMGESEIKLLLDIVEKRLTVKEVDGILKFDLSALWNLTDESPQACKLFVDLGGLDIYLRLLETFEDNIHIETRVLGLLNNIAEVEFLHTVMLLRKDLMDSVSNLISSSQMQVSYFACGIIANLALCWNNVHSSLSIDNKEEMLQKLDEAIKRWGMLDKEIVTYRSLKPFYELLRCYNIPEIQRWAVWAIHHVCTSCDQHYKDLMTEECIELLEQIRVNTHSIAVQTQCKEIYSAIKMWPCARESVQS